MNEIITLKLVLDGGKFILRDGNFNTIARGEYDKDSTKIVESDLYHEDVVELIYALVNCGVNGLI